LGRHIVKTALNNNHNVTLFNRGVSNPELFPDIEKIKGDRAGELDSLKGRKFDAVIDTSGYLPSIVKKSAEYLIENTNHYIYISSVSVYKANSENYINEASKLSVLENESEETLNTKTYGALKVLCEKKVLEIYKENCLILRSGLIVGEDDPYDRFTYWINRVNEGGTISTHVRVSPALPEDSDEPINKTGSI
jgi:2'-hydroxyisoflavone reductase